MAEVPGRPGVKPWLTLLLVTLFRHVSQSLWDHFPPWWVERLIAALGTKVTV